MGQCKFWIDLDGFVVVSQSLAGGFAGPPVCTGNPSHVMIVRVETVGWLEHSAPNFGLLQCRRNSPNNACRHLVLQLEDVFSCAIEPVRPEMRSRRGVN